MVTLMITDLDVKKLEKTFATKAEFRALDNKIDGVDKKLDTSVVELLSFIGDVKESIISEFRDLRGELDEFRNEIRGNTQSNQSILDNHESRISHLEYMGK
ncbi:MAG: hypothetical protein WAV29_00300 [Microgenomates group bacterium]